MKVISNTPEIRSMSKELFISKFGEYPNLKNEVTILMEDLEYSVPELNFYLNCKAGFVFDGASVPRVARPFISRSLLEQASTAHDILYVLKGLKNNAKGFNNYVSFNRDITRREADKIFKTHLKAEKIKKSVIRWSLFAIRSYGWVLWRKKFNAENVIFVDPIMIK